MASNGKTNFKFDITSFKICGNVDLMEKNSWKRNITVFLMVVVVLLQTASNLTGLFLNWSNFQNKIDNFLMTNIFITLSYELINFIVNKKENTQLILQIDSTINNYQVFYCKEKYSKSFLGKIADNIDKIIISLIFLLQITSVMWFIVPVISRNGALPFKNTWYPFDENNYYFYIYIFQVLADLYGGSNCFLIYFFYCKTTAIICEQFNILEHSLKNITTKEDTFNDAVIYERIVKCMMFHNEILKCCTVMQKSISGYLLCSLMVALSGLCFGAYAIVSIHELNQNLSNIITYIYTIGITFFIRCWLTHIITDHANKTTTAAYTSNWVDFDLKSKKAILFILQQSNRSILFKAGGIYAITLPTFIEILRLSFSYFTVLKNMANAEKQS